MTRSAFYLAFKLVVIHVKLKNVKHGVLRDAPVEVSETQILFHLIGLKKLAYTPVNYNIVCALYAEIPGGGGINNPPPP